MDVFVKVCRRHGHMPRQGVNIKTHVTTHYLHPPKCSGSAGIRSRVHRVVKQARLPLGNGIQMKIQPMTSWKKYDTFCLSFCQKETRDLSSATKVESNINKNKLQSGELQVLLLCTICKQSYLCFSFTFASSGTLLYISELQLKSFLRRPVN